MYSSLLPHAFTQAASAPEASLCRFPPKRVCRLGFGDEVLIREYYHYPEKDCMIWPATPTQYRLQHLHNASLSACQRQSLPLPGELSSQIEFTVHVTTLHLDTLKHKIGHKRIQLMMMLTEHAFLTRALAWPGMPSCVCVYDHTNAAPATPSDQGQKKQGITQRPRWLLYDCRHFKCSAAGTCALRIDAGVLYMRML